MDGVRTCWRNTTQMPFLLRTLCQGGMVAGPILLIILLAPGADWNVNGQRISYAELWQTGAGIVAVTFLGLATLGTWGMAARNAESRWALVLAPILPVALMLAFPRLRATMTIDIAFCVQLLIAPAIIYGCLFHLTSVENYLGAGEGSA